MTSPANTSGSDRETGTVERLVAEMQAGLEGVTPGPWSADSIKSDGCYGSGDDTHEGFDAYAVYSEKVNYYGKPASICDTLNSDVGSIEEEWDDEGSHHAWDEQGRRNMEHFARCSPDNIAAILEDRTRLKARAEKAEAERDRLQHERDYSVRWANRSVDSVKDECFARLEASEAKLATAREALAKWQAYDALLRTIDGDVLYGGEMPEVDAIYDDCVAKTDAALRSITEGADHERS